MTTDGCQSHLHLVGILDVARSRVRPFSVYLLHEMTAAPYLIYSFLDAVLFVDLAQLQLLFASSAVADSDRITTLYDTLLFCAYHGHLADMQQRLVSLRAMRSGKTNHDCNFALLMSAADFQHPTTAWLLGYEIMGIAAC